MKLRVFLYTLLLASCSAEEEMEVVYPFEVPEQLGKMPSFKDNTITKEGIELGRRLFYDTRLSADNSISCASCHQQSRAFADDVALSGIGISKKPLIRNTPPLFNLSWHTGYFWEGGSTNLELQALGPLTHNDEMGKDPRVLIIELSSDTLYPSLFKKAFGKRAINLRKIAYAIGQFERSLISANSRYDQYKSGQLNLTPSELNGEKLFNKQCASCHSGPLFTDLKYHNNGLDDSWYYTDIEDPRLGRYRVTLDSADLGKYKTASLRNLVFTPPYMHDGRYSSIEEVVEFYSKRVMASQMLDSILKPYGGQGIEFSYQEKIDLTSFLKTLTDSSFVQNPSYSNPYLE